MLTWFLPGPRRCYDPSPRPAGRHGEHGLGFAETQPGPPREGLPGHPRPRPSGRGGWFEFSGHRRCCTSLFLQSKMTGSSAPIPKDSSQTSKWKFKTWFDEFTGTCSIRTPWPAMTCMQSGDPTGLQWGPQIPSDTTATPRHRIGHVFAGMLVLPNWMPAVHGTVHTIMHGT